MHTSHPVRNLSTIFIAALMLFSMFFGAGNLIFPPALGAEAGENFIPALIGFLLTGVALPVLGILAIAISGRDIHDLANRGGVIFGVLFPVLVYLSIGAFYALPRTAVVSFSTAVVPIFGIDSLPAAALFSALFFGITFALCLHTGTIVDALGKVLTPLLLLLLAVLVILGISTFSGDAPAPTEKYGEHPLSIGFISGYLTMDSLAALAFGIIVVSSLQHKGIPQGRALTRGVSIAGIIAGVLLAIVYAGLAIIGAHIPQGRSFEDGAQLLSYAAEQTMGSWGASIFGLIVLLACLTTAVGLLGATSEFFAKLVPAISYRVWLVIFSLIAFALSTLGLSAVLMVAAPIIGVLYPAAITLIFLTLIEPFTGKNLYWTFRGALGVAVAFASLSALNTLGWGSAIIAPLISWSPGFSQELGWAVPTLIAAVIGFVLDARSPRALKKATAYSA
ncbi:branched-chain amino acid transport system II carrier protein [Rothia sp. CCM 9418]|uniref:branched-chain amino acid transport system II carrier protein n=1 Tax=Rothia sp. CCM 9418 TaxID=3402661 RepID=UPI003ADB4378